MSSIRWMVAVGLLLNVSGQVFAQTNDDFVPVTDAMLQGPDPADWLMWEFQALDHKTGKVLWEINLGSSVTGFPITYAVDGRQYVVVSTGTSMSSRDSMRLTPELRPSTGNNLFVFVLPK